MSNMATLSIKLSQAVVDQQHTLEQQNGAFNESLGGLLDVAGSPGDLPDPGQPVGWTLDGTTLVVRYTSGATETYTNVVRDNPAASSGHATATGYTFEQNGVVGMSGAGKFNFDYTLTGDNLSATSSAQGHLLTYLHVATELPVGSLHYDPVFGNVAVSLRGSLTLTPAGDTSGTFTNITVDADKFLATSSVDGNFHIDTARSGEIDGTLTAYREQYRDGSLVQLAGVSVNANANQGLSGSLLRDPRYFAGDDDITVDLPGRLYDAVMLQAGAGNDRISVNGGGGQLGVMAGDGNDQITLLGGAHTVDGGAGIDTVRLSMAHTDATIQRIGTTGSTYTVTDRAGTVQQLTGVERIAFSDTTLALDIDGNGGQVYRIYQAAFNRAPDAGGLGYWIRAMDHGQSLASVAQGFLDSAEYHKAYDGVASNRELVTRYYENILHRSPDAGGLDFWAGVLDSKAAGTADVLASISDSAENKAGLVGVIGNGFEYTPYGQG
jgi:hypothetical protein